jgi:mannose-1-phosphate guanylyltransferase
LVTFGIQPTYPATTYGYIERGDPERTIKAADGPISYRVRHFREKPDLATAQQFLELGGFYWNAGIFVWKAQTILAALAEYEPAMVEQLQPIIAAHGTSGFEQTFQQRFTAIRGKSIDYAVMERHKNVIVLEAPFAWDDVGNWRSLARTRGTDADGNTIVGKHVGLKSSGTIVRTDEQHLVVTVGVKDCIVVHTPDATLVAHKDDEESVRQVVERLKELGWEQFL